MAGGVSEYGSRKTGLPFGRGACFGVRRNLPGALALVAFTVNRAADGKRAAASIREVVTVLAESPGLLDRPPLAMSIKLANGIGSDVQVFGYDESSLPPAEHAHEREVAKAARRHYRQELYMGKDQQPFAVVDWLHTTTSIRILRVEGPASH